MAAIDFDKVMSTKELIKELTKFEKKHPGSKVSLRQTTGTDFPPFLTVEDNEEFEKNNEELFYENLWL